MLVTASVSRSPVPPLAVSLPSRKSKVRSLPRFECSCTIQPRLDDPCYHPSPPVTLNNDAAGPVTPAISPGSQSAALSNHYATSSAGVTRLPPILGVEKPQVTTSESATQMASASRCRNDAHFQCPIPDCGSTFTRQFNLRRTYLCCHPLALLKYDCSATAHCLGHLRSHTALFPPANVLHPQPTMNRNFSDRSSDSLVSVGSRGAVTPDSDVPIHDHSPPMSGSNNDIEKILTYLRQDSGEWSRRQQTDKSAMPRGTMHRYYAELAEQVPDSQDSNMSNIDILKHGEFKCASHRRYTPIERSFTATAHIRKLKRTLEQTKIELVHSDAELARLRRFACIILPFYHRFHRPCLLRRANENLIMGNIESTERSPSTSAHSPSYVPRRVYPIPPRSLLFLASLLPYR